MGWETEAQLGTSVLEGPWTQDEAGMPACEILATNFNALSSPKVEIILCLWQCGFAIQHAG